MSDLFKVLVGGGIKPKPPQPATSQVIACPANYTGPGQTQTRSANWNVATQTWDTSAWVTTVFNCVPAAFTFVGPDEVVGGGWVLTPYPGMEQSIVYDRTITAMGFTARIKAIFAWHIDEGEGSFPAGISYEVWCPELAGRLCRPHWKAEGPSWKGPESNWQAFAPLDGSGYLHVPFRNEPEYGSGPYHRPKYGEVIGCNIDIQ